MILDFSPGCGSDEYLEHRKWIRDGIAMRPLPSRKEAEGSQSTLRNLVCSITITEYLWLADTRLSFDFDVTPNVSLDYASNRPFPCFVQLRVHRPKLVSHGDHPSETFVLLCPASEPTDQYIQSKLCYLSQSIDKARDDEEVEREIKIDKFRLSLQCLYFSRFQQQ